MRPDPLPGLRPRRPEELYDAAFSLLHAHPALLGALGSLHSLPLAAGLAALALLPGRAFALEHPSLPLAALSLLTALGLLLRPISGAAVGRAADLLARGGTPRAETVLGEAFARRRPVLDVAARAFLADLLSAGLPRAAGLRHTLVPLVAIEERAPAPARLEAARLVRAHPAAHVALNLHGALLWLVVAINLYVGALLGVEGGRILLGLEWSVLAAFVSPRNPSFALLAAGLAVLVLEPVRALVKPLFLLDLRLREEGRDLMLRIERLP